MPKRNVIVDPLESVETTFARCSGIKGVVLSLKDNGAVERGTSFLVSEYFDDSVIVVSGEVEEEEDEEDEDEDLDE